MEQFKKVIKIALPSGKEVKENGKEGWNTYVIEVDACSSIKHKIYMVCAGENEEQAIDAAGEDLAQLNWGDFSLDIVHTVEKSSEKNLDIKNGS